MSDEHLQHAGNSDKNDITVIAAASPWGVSTVYTDEQAQDAAAAMLTAGQHTGVTATAPTPTTRPFSCAAACPRPATSGSPPPP